MHPSDSTSADGLIHLQAVVTRPVNWVWPGWIPLRKITVVDGDPGLGKSTLLLDLAARVSRMDTMPDGSRGRYGEVLLMIAEDSLEDTVKPRLLAARANLDRIHSFEFVRDRDGTRPPVLPDDIGRLEELVKAHEVRMVVIDPFVAYLSATLDNSRDQHMRRALHLLGKLAERQECAVILLRHLNKGAQSKAIYRGGGSIGIIAAARAGILVARDPTNERCRVLLISKTNLAVIPTGLKYELVTTQDKQVVVAWRGLCHASADGVLEARGGQEQRTALEEAVQFLMDVLAEGDHEYHALVREAKASGVHERTLRRAKGQLGIRSYRVGNPAKGMKWFWSIQPKSEATAASGRAHSKSETPTGSPSALQQDRAQQCPGSWADILGSEG
jgi:hypothetical protein